MTRLKNKTIEDLEVKVRNYKYWIGEGLPGLHVHVAACGTKHWRAKVHIRGKEHTICLGTYPYVDVDEARRLHEKVRFYVDQGINPKLILKKQTLKKGLETPEILQIAIKIARKFDPERVLKFPKQEVLRTMRSQGIDVNLSRRELDMITYLVINWME